MGAYKMAVRRLAQRSGNPDWTWQRNYYEHVIRNASDWAKINSYIEANPAAWEQDEDNPTSAGQRKAADHGAV